MRVDGVPSQSAIAIQMHKKAHSVTEEIPVETEETQAVESTESGDGAKGVIRLLQEGHFKGVADVRLRISHFEELQNIDAQNLKDSAAEGFEDLNQTIQDQITPLLESGQLSEDQITALGNFLSDLQTEQTGFLETDGGSLQGLIDSWKTKLDGLMDILNPPAPTEEEPIVEQAAAPEPQVESQQATEEPSSEEPTPEVTGEMEPQAGVQEAPAETTSETVPEETEPTEESNPYQDFQNSILEAFETFLSNLDESSSSLPPLSEPSGNGKAYAKFLEIYETMQAGGTTDPSESELLDVGESATPEETEPLSEVV